jgi:rSAM/selenodomain-associated transferase 2
VKVAAVIPTFDEAEEVPRVLDHLAVLPGEWEVVVADGGSRDGTVDVARSHPLAPRVIERRGGRAAQLNAGVAASTGDPVLFLHADSRLPAGAFAALAGTGREVVGGNFALRFDGGDRFSRVLGGFYRFQRRFGFYYGDSSVWVRRAAFERLGGYRAVPIMDDYDFVRRLEKSGPTACLPGPATTSARRWKRIGIVRTMLSWWVIRWLFIVGYPPEKLARMYRHVR